MIFSVLKIISNILVLCIENQYICNAMDKKFKWKRALAVCLCLVFTWAAVSLWVFSYEIVEYTHIPLQWIEVLSIVMGCLGLSFSCLAYERKL